MGRALSHRRDRQVAGESQGPDRPVRDRSTGLDREGTASLDHERTGEGNPDIDTDRPVSRHEMRYLGYYGCRSCKAVMSYHIEASDGGIGHVENLPATLAPELRSVRLVDGLLGVDPPRVCRAA